MGIMPMCSLLRCILGDRGAGPMEPHISPQEALARLRRFQKQYEVRSMAGAVGHAGFPSMRMHVCAVGAWSG